MNFEITSADLFFKKSMGVLGIIFLIGAILFALIPEQLESMLNWFAGIIKMDKAPVVKNIPVSAYWAVLNNDNPIPPEMGALPSQRLWNGLSVAMMVMITVICLACYVNAKKYMNWVPLLLISKGTSSLMGLFTYFYVHKYLTNLIALITDFPIFLFVLFIYLRALNAKTSMQQSATKSA